MSTRSRPARSRRRRSPTGRRRPRWRPRIGVTCPPDPRTRPSSSAGCSWAGTEPSPGRCSSPEAGSRPSASPPRCGRRRRRPPSSTAAPPGSRPGSSIRTSTRTSAGGFPDPGMRPAYSHREQWQGRAGDEHYPLEYARTEAPVQQLWIELRHLLAGTTTLGGSGAAAGLLKNASWPDDPAYVYRGRHADVPLRHRHRDVLRPDLPLRRTGARRSGVEPGLSAGRALHAAHRGGNELHGGPRGPVLSGPRRGQPGPALRAHPRRRTGAREHRTAGEPRRHPGLVAPVEPGPVRRDGGRAGRIAGRRPHRARLGLVVLGLVQPPGGAPLRRERRPGAVGATACRDAISGRWPPGTAPTPWASRN